jgi:hypothetical protein
MEALPAILAERQASIEAEPVLTPEEAELASCRKAEQAARDESDLIETVRLMIRELGIESVRKRLVSA